MKTIAISKIHVYHKNEPSKQLASPPFEAWGVHGNESSVVEISLRASL